jgi:hypothetical protein
LKVGKVFNIYFPFLNENNIHIVVIKVDKDTIVIYSVTVYFYEIKDNNYESEIDKVRVQNIINNIEKIRNRNNKIIVKKIRKFVSFENEFWKKEKFLKFSLLIYLTLGLIDDYKHTIQAIEVEKKVEKVLEYLFHTDKTQKVKDFRIRITCQKALLILVRYVIFGKKLFLDKNELEFIENCTNNNNNNNNNDTLSNNNNDSSIEVSKVPVDNNNNNNILIPRYYENDNAVESNVKFKPLNDKQEEDKNKTRKSKRMLHSVVTLENVTNDSSDDCGDSEKEEAVNELKSKHYKKNMVFR